MTDQPRKRITIDAPDGPTILAARHLDATEGRVQIGSSVDTSTRSAITRVLGYIAKAHGSPGVPASSAPLAAGLPLVRGNCPACGRTSLFLGDGGHVTCSIIDCPNPSAADEQLHGEQPASDTTGDTDDIGPAKPGMPRCTAAWNTSRFGTFTCWRAAVHNNDEYVLHAGESEKGWRFSWLDKDHGAVPHRPEETDTAPAATEDGWQQQDDGTWTLPVDGGTVLFTRRSTPEERARFAEKWAEQVKPAPAASEEQTLVHALGGDRTAEIIARTLTVHGHTLNAVRTMTYAELLAVPGIGGPSLARIRAALDGCPEPDDTDQTEPATITDPEWLRQQYAAAVQPLLMDVLPKPIAAARAWDIADTILFVRDRHLAQLRQRLELADATLGDRAAAGAQARTTPDNGATSEDAADNPLREKYAAAIGAIWDGWIADWAGTDVPDPEDVLADAVSVVRDRELEQLAAAHIRDQSALAQIRLHVAAHRQRLKLADPVLLAKLEAVLREVGELEAAETGERL